MARCHRDGRQNQAVHRLDLGETRDMNFRFSMSDSRTSPRSKIQNLKSKIADYGRLVRFSHTVFALPFALASVALAWPKHPVTLRALLWILVAMVGARTAAMGFNRLVDREFD